MKDQRRLQHLPVEAVGTGKGAFAEACILVSGELAIEIGERLVGGEPPFDEELFALQGKPPELGPRSQRSGKRLLVEGNCGLHRLRHRSHPAAAGKERAAGGVTMIEGEIDGGLLHRPVGLDDQTVAEGDVLLVVNPLDIRRRAPRHLLLQFAVAADGEVEQLFSGPEAFPAPLPCPVGPGSGAHPVEAAALDHRLGEGDVELGLGAGCAGSVDVGFLANGTVRRPANRRRWPSSGEM